MPTKRASAKKREIVLTRLRRKLWEEEGFLTYQLEENSAPSQVAQAAFALSRTAHAIYRATRS